MHIDKLINTVQQYPVLWNRKDKKYRNRQITSKAWSSVAKVMGCTKDEAKKKWKNLRDTYSREVKKKVRNPNADQEESYAGDWSYFEPMGFIKATLRPRTVAAEDDTSQSSDADSDMRTGIPSLNVTQQEFTRENGDKAARERVVTSSNQSSKLKKSAKKRKLHDNLEKAFLEMERQKNEFLSRDMREKDDDEDMNWFKSIMPHLQQLPPLNKLLFRTNVQEMLVSELSKINSHGTSLQIMSNMPGTSGQPFYPDHNERSTPSISKQSNPSDYGS